MAVGNRHLGTQLSHLTFMAFFALYAGAAGAWLAMGLAPAVAATFPAIHTRLHTWGAGAAAANIAAWDSEAFNLKELAFQTGTTATISFENSHSGGRHNVAIYTDASGKEAIFKGAVITGPARTDYTFTAPARGTYYFRCDIYPNMNGSVIVLNGSAAIRSPALAAMAGGIAVASHAAEHAGHVTLQYLFSLVNIGLGVFLMRLRPRDRAARFLALGLVGTGAVFNVQSHSAEVVMPGLASVLHESFHVVSGIAYVYALLLFPDGRLPHWSIPRWIKWPARVLYLLTLTFVGLFFSMLSHGEPEGFIAFFGVLIPVAGLTSQAFRYRHAHTAAERQQSRVLMWALILALGTVVLLGISVLALNVLGPGLSRQTLANLKRFVFLVFPPLFAVIPLTLFTIMVRYRLWDMDRVINRALVYGVLSSILALMYFTGVVLLGWLLRTMTGQGTNDLAVVVSTLTVAALFRPLRRRVQEFIDRRFYRRKYDAARTLQAFAATINEEVDLDRLAATLLAVVEETMQPMHVSLWLREDPARRQIEG